MKQKVDFIFLRKIGLHPLSAFAAICVDLMLFGSEALVPPSVVLTIFFGLLICFPVYLLQRYGSGDSSKLAFAKAMIIGILTAIPSPLPSFLTGLGGLLGIIGAVTSGSGATTTSQDSFDKASEVCREEKRGKEKDYIDIEAE